MSRAIKEIIEGFFHDAADLEALNKELETSLRSEAEFSLERIAEVHAFIKALDVTEALDLVNKLSQHNQLALHSYEQWLYLRDKRCLLPLTEEQFQSFHLKTEVFQRLETICQDYRNTNFPLENTVQKNETCILIQDISNNLNTAMSIFLMNLKNIIANYAFKEGKGWEVKDKISAKISTLWSKDTTIKILNNICPDGFLLPWNQLVKIIKSNGFPDIYANLIGAVELAIKDIFNAIKNIFLEKDVKNWLLILLSQPIVLELFGHLGYIDVWICRLNDIDSSRHYDDLIGLLNPYIDTTIGIAETPTLNTGNVDAEDRRIRCEIK